MCLSICECLFARAAHRVLFILDIFYAVKPRLDVLAVWINSLTVILLVSETTVKRNQHSEDKRGDKQKSLSSLFPRNLNVISQWQHHKSYCKGHLSFFRLYQVCFLTCCFYVPSRITIVFTIEFTAHQLHAQGAGPAANHGDDADVLGHDWRVKKVGLCAVVIYVANKNLQ